MLALALSGKQRKGAPTRRQINDQVIAGKLKTLGHLERSG